MDSFGGIVLLHLFVMFCVDGLFFFLKNFGFLFFEIFETENEGFEGLLLGFLEDEILDGGIWLVIHLILFEFRYLYFYLSYLFYEFISIGKSFPHFHYHLTL